MTLPRPAPPADIDLGERPEPDEMTGRILDAAYEEFQEFGLRRGSIDSVARRIGVGRMTVYRRYSNKEALAQAVFLREAQQFFAQVRRDLHERTVEAGVSEGFAAGVLSNRGQTLVYRMIERDPVEMLPYFFGESARPLIDITIAVVREAVGKARDADEYEPESLDAVAEAMVRLAHSYSSTSPAAGLPRTELLALSERLLIPLLRRADVGPR